ARGGGSYWSLDSEEKQHLGLPTLFDPELFGSMDVIIKPPEDQAGSGDVDSENLMDTAGGSEDLIVTMEAEDANGAQESEGAGELTALEIVPGQGVNRKTTTAPLYPRRAPSAEETANKLVGAFVGGGQETKKRSCCLRRARGGRVRDLLS
ncbi:hypothetical protein B296_00023696, partial [Ensete ventricosum]